MAKCSNAERTLLDSLFEPDVDLYDLKLSVLNDRITKEMRQTLKNSAKAFNNAHKELELARSMIIELCTGDQVLAYEIINQIESESQ